jgi:hypothetical protein
MTADGPACPDCGVPTEIGALLDHSHGVIMNLTWHAGLPNDRKFLGLKTGGVAPVWKNVMPAVAYRCPQCGLLRLYAGIDTPAPAPATEEGADA